MKNYHDPERLENTLENIETIFHRGTESDRKQLIKAFAQEMGRLPNEYYTLFLDILTEVQPFDVEEYTAESEPFISISEFDERDDDKDRMWGQFLD